LQVLAGLGVCVQAVADESTVLSQLDEASQLSATLQRGLDMCTSITASCTTCAEPVTSDHPLARQLDELRRLYRQV